MRPRPFCGVPKAVEQFLEPLELISLVLLELILKVRSEVREQGLAQGR